MNDLVLASLIKEVHKLGLRFDELRRTEQKGRWLGRIFHPLIDLVFLPLEKDHCRTAFESERNGRHLPEEYRV